MWFEGRWVNNDCATRSRSRYPVCKLECSAANEVFSWEAWLADREPRARHRTPHQAAIGSYRCRNNCPVPNIRRSEFRLAGNRIRYLPVCAAATGHVTRENRTAAARFHPTCRRRNRGGARCNMLCDCADVIVAAYGSAIVARFAPECSRFFVAQMRICGLPRYARLHDQYRNALRSWKPASERASKKSHPKW